MVLVNVMPPKKNSDQKKTNKKKKSTAKKTSARRDQNTLKAGAWSLVTVTVKTAVKTAEEVINEERREVQNCSCLLHCCCTADGTREFL